MAPRDARRGGQAFELGRASRARIDFAGRAAKFVAADAFEKSAGSSLGSRNLSKVRCGSTLEETMWGGKFFAVLKGNAAGAAVLDRIFPRELWCGFRHLGFAAASAMALEMRRAPREAPGPACAAISPM